jgi:hypothetical protein
LHGEGREHVSTADDIVDRAIEYTNRILGTMPNYRTAAITGLRRLRDSLAKKSPHEPALNWLDDYIDKLDDR